MAIIKETTIDQITVIKNGTVFYREVNKISEDGTLLSQTYHRNSLAPASDLIGVPNNVVAICNAAWTPEIVAAYQALLVI